MVRIPTALPRLLLLLGCLAASGGVGGGAALAAQGRGALPALPYAGTLLFPDGTPVRSLDGINGVLDACFFFKGACRFTIPATPAGESGGARRLGVGEDGSFVIALPRPGEYRLRFMGVELARFRVEAGDGVLTANAPPRVLLPFNMALSTNPGRTLRIFEASGALVKTVTADQDGHIFFKEPPAFFADKLFVAPVPGRMPATAFFPALPAGKAGELRYRHREFKPRNLPAGIMASICSDMDFNSTVIHDIATDSYYRLRQVSRKKGQRRFWLIRYQPAKEQVTVRRLAFPRQVLSPRADLHLDYEGRVVIRLVGRDPAGKGAVEHAFRLEAGGGLTPIGTHHPSYVVKGRHIQGHVWRVPTFAGIALEEGRHTLVVTCSGSWNEPNPAYGAWHERHQSIMKQPLKERGAALQALGKEPAAGIPHSGTRTSAESFRVVYTPGRTCRGKVLNPDYERALEAGGAAGTAAMPEVCVEGDASAPGSVVFFNPLTGDLSFQGGDSPDGIAADSGLDAMDIERCTISVDGLGPLPYSYTDSFTGAACLSLDYPGSGFNTLEECTAAALRNARVFVGFGEDVDPWGQGIDLARPGLKIVAGPLNRWEGPYPELRYLVSTVVGEYPSYEAASEHCRKPSRRRRYGRPVYACTEETPIRICPENYRVVITDGTPVIDYDALYCGKVAETREVELSLAAAADGYQPSPSVFKTFPGAGRDVAVTGTVRSSAGEPVAGAVVTLPELGVSVKTDSAGRYRIPPQSGTQKQSWQEDFFLRRIVQAVSARLEVLEPVYANGREGRLRLTVTADGRPYANRIVYIDQTGVFELWDRPTRLVAMGRYFSRKLTTDGNGQVTFELYAPQVVPGILSPEQDHRAFFPVTGYLELRGEWTSDKDFLVPYQVESPFPVIEKLIVTGNVDAGTWQITPSRVWIRDPDSSRFEIRVEASGWLKERQGPVRTNALTASSAGSPFEFHYKPPRFGLDLNRQPDLARQLLAANLKAGLSIILSVLENDMLKAPPARNEGGALFHDLDDHLLDGKLGTMQDKSLLEDLGRKWFAAAPKGGAVPSSRPLLAAFDKAKNGLALLDRTTDTINLQAGGETTFLQQVDYLLGVGDTIWGLIGATHGTYTEVAKLFWENSKVLYGAYTRYQDINLAYQDVIFLPVTVTVTDEQGHATQKVQRCSVRFWKRLQ